MCNVVEEQVLVESFSFQAPDIFTAKKYVDLIVDSEEDIELETMNETVKSPRADLSGDDLKKISDEQMLTDNVINVLQKRLKRNFTDAMGLQDTLLVQSLTCNVYQNKPFVQAIHNGRYHFFSAHMDASTAKYLYWIISSVTHCQFKQNNKSVH